jgi:hypothetical protein
MINDSTFFDSYLPVYDAVPETWEEAKPFFVEVLKKISEVTNRREIGWLLDEEVLTGKAFIPAVPNPTGEQAPYRQVLRKVIDLGALVAGVNPGVAHGILFDFRFTLIDMWVAGTNSGTLTARVINGNDVLMTATQIIVTSPQIFDRAFCFIEYCQEV